MIIDFVFEALGNKTNLLYIAFSLLGLHINFTIVNKILKSENPASHLYAIITSLALPLFHFYVFNFGRIPFVDIYIDNNIPLYYISFGLAWLSSLPYIIARKLHS